MIPIRDTQISSRTPVVTYILIALNTLVFGYQLAVGLDHQGVFYVFGLVPAKYTVREFSSHFTFANQILSVFTYMFLHGGFMHFIGNMWTLYIFGDNVEDHFGHFRFLGIYLIWGVISGLFHFLLNPVSTIPTVGASGAIAGVMGAYFLLYPRSKVLTVVPILIIPFFFEIPAFVFLGIWFIFQFLNAAVSGAGAGIAWWAHIGGFIAGVAAVLMNRKLPRTGASQTFEQFTAKKKTPKLQVIHTSDIPQSLDLYGIIEISSIEAITGARKMVSIPWGFYKPLYRVNIPPGIKQGTKLRLAGMGKTSYNGQKSKGDLYLEVRIRNAI